MKGRENTNVEENCSALTRQSRADGESLEVGEMKLHLPLKFDTLPSNYKTRKLNVHSN